MLEFFKQLSVFQWILIGCGLFLLLPNVVDLFKRIPMPKINNTPKDSSSHALTNIVCEWECLYESCKSKNLLDACDQLEKVFPLLVKVREDNNNPKTYTEENTCKSEL